MAVVFPMVIIMVPIASLAGFDEMFFDLGLVRYELLFKFGVDFFEGFDNPLPSGQIRISKATFDVQLMVSEAILPGNRRHIFMCGKGISSLLDSYPRGSTTSSLVPIQSLVDDAAGPDTRVDVYDFHLISAVLFDRLPGFHGQVVRTYPPVNQRRIGIFILQLHGAARVELLRLRERLSTVRGSSFSRTSLSPCLVPYIGMLYRDAIPHYDKNHMLESADLKRQL